MKKAIVSSLLVMAVLASTDLLAQSASANPSGIQSATSSGLTINGSISSVSQGSDMFVLRPQPQTAAQSGIDQNGNLRAQANAPTNFYWTKDTVFVDQDGKTLTFSDLKSSYDATVYYTTQGDRTLATKVILRRNGTGTGSQ
jgi:hypothetical protein